MAMYMYITVSEEDRIARYEVDVGTGALTHIGDVGDCCSTCAAWR